MSVPATDQRAYRLESIDLLRGLVIVIMALDHCRDFFMVGTLQNPMADPNVSPGVFFTRWVTHFCAPVFVFLAGTSAGLMLARKAHGELGRFLLARGLWLIAIEAVLITGAWTFRLAPNPALGGKVLIIFQVIWALGASMVALSAFQWMGRRTCLVLGAVIVLGHNLLDPVWPVVPEGPTDLPFWVSLHAQMGYVAGPFVVRLAYPVLPWIGVMLLGFGSAGLFERPEPQRRAGLVRAGLLLTAAFLLVRALDVYGDPQSWHTQPAGLLATLMSFLNTSKYPPSLDYLLMTLGPAAIFCAYADRLPAALRGALATLGRVPFAFYVAHIYLIHLLSIALGMAQGFALPQFLNVFIFYPPGYGVQLPGVYLGWVVVVVALYPFCRWVASVKARRRDWWLSYV
jgi:uncharacterized membrane protein